MPLMGQGAFTEVMRTTIDIDCVAFVIVRDVRLQAMLNSRVGQVKCLACHECSQAQESPGSSEDKANVARFWVWLVLVA